MPETEENSPIDDFINGADYIENTSNQNKKDTVDDFINGADYTDNPVKNNADTK